MDPGELDKIYLALIVAVPAITSPIILAGINGFLARREKREESLRRSEEKRLEAELRRVEKREDYARQDAVTERAESATRLAAQAAEAVKAQAAKAAELLIASDEKNAARADVMSGKLDVIHTLVNSNMTAAMTSEYEAIRREYAMMLEVIDLKKVAGHEPTLQTLATLKATEAKIAELAATLDDRSRGDEAAAETNRKVSMQLAVEVTDPAAVSKAANKAVKPAGK